MKKLLYRAVLAALALALALPSSALAERKWFEIEGESASFCFQDGAKLTFVTPDTLEENMALCLAHGGTEQGIRERFSTGHVVWEAYRPEVEGRFRLEIYEDEWTHYAWDSQTMSLSLMKNLGSDLLEAEWLGDHYHFMKLIYKVGYEDTKYLQGNFLSQLPYEYESGVCSLYFYNGKAFMFIYADSKPASTSGLWSESTSRWVNFDNSPLSIATFFRRDSKALAQAQHMVDLLPDRSQLILNLHPGAYALEGRTEKGAAVTLENNGEQFPAQVNEKEYKGSVPLTDGENSVVIRARKGEQPENAIPIHLPVNAGMAALTLTQYPYGHTDRDKLRVKGFTDPAGSVTIAVDEGEPIAATVQADGSFDVAYEASDWEQHAITITASQEGLEDCAARFSFTPTYEDVEKGVRAYRKTLDEAVKPQLIIDHPQDYVGKRFSLEIRVQSWTIHDGMISMEVHLDNLQNRNMDMYAYTTPIYLIFDSYADDFFRAGQELTVLGEMLEPTQTDPAYPRMQVQYAEYVIGGRLW